MNDEIKQKILDTNTWLRGLFMLLFFLIAGVARFVIAVVVLFILFLVKIT